MAAIAYPHPAGQSRNPARPHLRLVPPPARRLPRSAVYRRRRFAVIVALFVTVFLLVLAARAALGALGGGPLAASETPAARGGAAAVFMVQPGDTYWTIARRLQPTGDVRALVDKLSSEHGGGPLQPGEQLVLR